MPIVFLCYASFRLLGRNKQTENKPNNQSAMDSTPVNWEALDSLVLDFVESEHLIQSEEAPTAVDNPNPSSAPLSPESDSSPSTSSCHSSSSSSSYRSRVIIRRIRRCVESGDIDAALEQLRLHIPVVLDDHRVLFRLQKQVIFCYFDPFLLVYFYLI
jgi:hypothetical protein